MKKNTNQIFDQALNDIRHDEPDHATINAAADRVWARVANHEAEVAITNTVQAEHLRDCNDFQSLIPAYLSKQLTSARVLLLEDHTRECFACRKELKAARTATAKPQVGTVLSRRALPPLHRRRTRCLLAYDHLWQSGFKRTLRWRGHRLLDCAACRGGAGCRISSRTSSAAAR